MAGYILWGNVDRVNLVRYVGTVIQIPEPDRPEEKALTHCEVFRSQDEAVRWCADVINRLTGEIMGRGDVVHRSEMAG